MINAVDIPIPARFTAVYILLRCKILVACLRFSSDKSILPKVKKVQKFYSVRRFLTGLASAALTAWKLIVATAINKAINAAIANTAQLMFIRYSKSCNHLFMKYQASGAAITKAITT